MIYWEKVASVALRLRVLPPGLGWLRTTIYRWWPSKGALAMEGFLEGDRARPACCRQQPLLPKLTFVPCCACSPGFCAAKRGPIIRGIIAEGQSDPDTINAFMTGFRDTT